MPRITENRNPASSDIDKLATEQALRIINAEDRLVPEAVSKSIDDIAAVVDECAARLSAGGRLIYVGTGTSGRLGVLDASEIPPTFGIDPGIVLGLIAGGPEALVSAVEGAEDDTAAAAADLGKLKLNEADAVVCLSASGDTPYTVAAAEFARSLGCYTAGVTCNPEGKLNTSVERAVCVETGPEVIAGSTRMKAGSAQKLVLNMISTMVMVRLGYTSGNVMTNLRTANAKLVGRAVEILKLESGLSAEEAQALLEQCGSDLRVALVSARSGSEPKEARNALEANAFVIEKALEHLRS